MANLPVADCFGSTKYIKATGAGTNDDPFVVQHSIGAGVISLTCVKGTCSTSGDNQLVAAPGAGNEIVPVSWEFWADEAGPLGMILGSDTVDVAYYTAQSAGQGVAGAIVPGFVLGIGANAALELNLSEAKDAGYCVRYYVRAV